MFSVHTILAVWKCTTWLIVSSTRWRLWVFDVGLEWVLGHWQVQNIQWANHHFLQTTFFKSKVFWAPHNYRGFACLADTTLLEDTSKLQQILTTSQKAKSARNQTCKSSGVHFWGIVAKSTSKKAPKMRLNLDKTGCFLLHLCCSKMKTNVTGPKVADQVWIAEVTHQVEGAFKAKKTCKVLPKNCVRVRCPMANSGVVRHRQKNKTVSLIRFQSLYK